MAPDPPAPVAPVAPVTPAAPAIPFLFHTTAFSPFLQLLPMGMKRTALVFLLTQPLICPLVVARRACRCMTEADARVAPAIIASAMRMTTGDIQRRCLLCTDDPFRDGRTPVDRQLIGLCVDYERALEGNGATSADSV